ncbi:MAG TPA: SDR family NAD(P)-dependent oxidoreductase [Myxococcota bacterium]|nr:SDR family NAD(P)-dependent oxidoreductase [Myxococcota bacterium]
MGRVEGKFAIVTGAARGTGERTARLLAAEGAQVLLCDVLDAQGEAVAKDIGKRAAYAHLDVTSEPEWAARVADARREHGRIDVLVPTTQPCCGCSRSSRRRWPTTSAWSA